ncbi:MAG: UDP-N-acetylmuramate dehydrogenase [Flavobacteriaceae bacterium]|nr:UDP-N-acetylmuramate dehydrogenase [Flavobacteriaceae bacterium]MCY4266624.1 UDP-N-acetylmuramate dehydrogenase [Flavobacteriaceae bacterium]MCY4299472.1 UDP-N-acetylmuramate dehydrogenase [Flavobacteriaceae bacterium]
MALIQKNQSLLRYNTFGIDHRALYFAHIDSTDQLQEALQKNKTNKTIILGGGSNVLLTKDIEDSLVIHMANKGVEIVSKTKDWVIVEIQGGENWHEFVLWCLKKNLGGIENLALIPGQVGAAPIQNIGAYGVELERVFVSCQAFDLKSGRVVCFTKQECGFDYRNSIFKREFPNRFIILTIRFKLSVTNHHLEYSYESLKKEMRNQNPTIESIAKAVMRIRSRKLPDPLKLGNAGSFFKNPTISQSKFSEIKSLYEEIPHFKTTSGIKIPAGWLIEQVKLKGYRQGDAGVHHNQALVLVNYGKATGLEVFKLSQLVKNKVKTTFGIELEEEVRIL